MAFVHTHPGGRSMEMIGAPCRWLHAGLSSHLISNMRWLRCDGAVFPRLPQPDPDKSSFDETSEHSLFSPFPSFIRSSPCYVCAMLIDSHYSRTIPIPSLFLGGIRTPTPAEIYVEPRRDKPKQNKKTNKAEPSRSRCVFTSFST